MASVTSTRLAWRWIGGTRARIEVLVLPPAWEDVWICPLPHGHIQATGLDAAGRLQYR